MGFYGILENTTTAAFFPSLFKVNKHYLDIHLWTNSKVSYSKLPPEPLSSLIGAPYKEGRGEMDNNFSDANTPFRVPGASNLPLIC